MTMHEMAERIAEVQELERLRAENAALRRRVPELKEALKFEGMRAVMEASRPMSSEEIWRRTAVFLGPAQPSHFGGSLFGTSWP